jgi:hypothetical protein
MEFGESVSGPMVVEKSLVEPPRLPHCGAGMASVGLKSGAYIIELREFGAICTPVTRWKFAVSPCGSLPDSVSGGTKRSASGASSKSSNGKGGAFVTEGEVGALYLARVLPVLFVSILPLFRSLACTM